MDIYVIEFKSSAYYGRVESANSERYGGCNVNIQPCHWRKKERL